MKIKKYKIIIIAIFLMAFISHAQVSLPNIFSDHMVLQRHQENLVWGKSNIDEEVIVSIADQVLKTRADKKGDWSVKLKPMDAGGPFKLIIQASNKITYTDILVGEVWLCTGQSNMAMKLEGGPGQHIEGSNYAILNSTNLNLRLFTVDSAISDTPLDVLEGNWETCNPKTSAKFSAVGYFFGKMLQENLGIPIGLISSSVGGTPAQAWTSKEVLSIEFPEFNKASKIVEPTKQPSVLYNGMIHPLIPYGIKGAIWYQGEGNRWNPEQYSRLFPAMIKNWRTEWKQGNFPFYFVQLAPYGFKNIDGWVGVQQAQLKTMLTVQNTGMAVINDIGYKTRIHPPKKKEVGERLSFWALKKDYNIEGITHSGPIYKSMIIEGGKALISFDEAPRGITSLGKILDNFEISGADGVFYKAEAKILNKGEILQVWNDKVASPKNVRYGWNSYIEGSLFNTAGLPASSFSTETWNSILNSK